MNTANIQDARENLTVKTMNALATKIEEGGVGSEDAAALLEILRTICK